MRRRVPGIDERRHDVELDVRPDALEGVHVAVLRRNRGDAKGDYFFADMMPAVTAAPAAAAPTAMSTTTTG
jgi:hypothetical protein